MGWERVRGVDKSEVLNKTEVKSMMSSKNFRPSISVWSEAIDWLKILSSDLLARLTEARVLAPGLWPKTIVMHKRDAAQKTVAKQITFTKTSKLDLDHIFGHAERLLGEFGGLGIVTGLCIGFQGLVGVESGQRGIEGFFTAQGKGEKRGLEVGDGDGDGGPIAGPSSVDRLTYKCLRCGDVLRADDGDQLERVKTEHGDEHFARDLWDADLPRPKHPKDDSEKPAKKPKPKKVSDLTCFFKPVTSTKTQPKRKKHSD